MVRYLYCIIKMMLFEMLLNLRVKKMPRNTNTSLHYKGIASVSGVGRAKFILKMCISFLSNI